MNNSETLTCLRQAVAKLDRYEKLALATYLTGTANLKFQDLVIPDIDKLTGELAEACELSSIFSSADKIFFAIELLELHIDRDEFDEGGYEGEEDYIFYHGCDGDDFKL